MLETPAFRSGDQVSTTPTLYAAISDSNGINTLGSAGHKIILIIDDAAQPLDVTAYFVYDTNSCVKGMLTYQLPQMTEGRHKLQLVVFDNFNVPTISETSFMAKSSNKLAIFKMLPYPNPMKRDGKFTLVINSDADITISLYTITGRKIRTLKQHGILGYNQVVWDGRDEQGDYLANNTYFYKIRIKDGNSSAEKEGQFIIYH
jgi:hypothetical protein